MENEMKPAVKNTSKYVCNKRRSSRIQNLQSPELVPIESLPKLLNTSEFILKDQSRQEKELIDSPVEERFDCNNSEESNEALELTNNKTKIIKERKYFKRNNENSPKRSIQTEDDSKAYKIISTAIPVSPDSKLHFKTYTNPRRYSEKIDTVESFGLPDNPLTCSISNTLLPQLDQILDAEILDAKEITIQDVQFVEEPWCIIDLEQTFCELEEIRIKAEPQNHVNNNFQDKSVDNPKISKFKKTSPNKRKLPIANHSLNLEEHEFEIFNSSTFRNLFDSTSTKTNRMCQNQEEKLQRTNNYSERRKLRSNTSQEFEELLKKQIKSNDFVPKRVLRSNSCTDLYDLESIDNTRKLKKSKSQTDLYSDNRNIITSKIPSSEKSKKNTVKTNIRKIPNRSQHLKVILSPLKVAKNSRNASKKVHHLDINKGNSLEKIKSPSPTFSEMYLENDTFEGNIEPETDKSVINNNKNICTANINTKSNKNGLFLKSNDLDNINSSSEHFIKLRKHSQNNNPSEPKPFDLKSLISNFNANEGRKSKIMANEKLSKCFSPRSYVAKSKNFNVSPQKETQTKPAEAKKILLPDKRLKKITCKRRNKTIENIQISENEFTSIVETIKTEEGNCSEAGLHMNTEVIEDAQKELVKESVNEENKENNEIIEISMKVEQNSIEADIHEDNHNEENKMIKITEMVEPLKEEDVSFTTEDNDYINLEDRLKNIVSKQISPRKNEENKDNMTIKTKLLENSGTDTQTLIENTKSICSQNMEYETEPFFIDNPKNTILLKNIEELLDEEVSSITSSVDIETKTNHIEVTPKNKNKKPKTRMNGQITDLIVSPKLTRNKTDNDEYPRVTRSKTSLGGKINSIVEECISPNKNRSKTGVIYLEGESSKVTIPSIGKISRRKSTMHRRMDESNSDKEKITLIRNYSELENTDEIINNNFNGHLLDDGDNTNIISFKFSRFNENTNNLDERSKTDCVNNKNSNDIHSNFNKENFDDDRKQNIVEPNYSEQENINNKYINIDSPSAAFSLSISNEDLDKSTEYVKSAENTFLSIKSQNTWDSELEEDEKPEMGRFRSKSVASIHRSSSTSTKEQFKENNNFHVSRRKMSLEMEIPNKLNLVKRSHSVEPKQKLFKRIFSTYKIQSPAFMFKPKLGKIAWAQIGNFPYWPCIITKEPITKIFQKTVIKKFAPIILYHVRFFGDKGRRAWIFSRKLMEYSTRDDLKNIYDDLKQVKSIADLYAFCVKDKQVKKWTTAVEEVEYVKSHKYNLKQIIKFLDKTVESPKKLKEPFTIKTEDTTELNQLTEKTTNISENNKKKKKNNVKDSPNISQTDKPLKKEYDDSFSNEVEVTETQVNKDTTIELESIKIEEVTIKDEVTDIEYTTSVDSLNNFGSYSLEEQRSLFKRNSLFKGIPKDKVCQFCFNFADIYKCKGGCNGIYHLKCAMQVLIDKVPKRRKISVVTEKIGKREPSTSGSQSEIDENHVQIITVPSSVCGTPPRKTFPPDCMNMTLAERIDFKMKEIMKKFESKAYLEMLSECGSDEKPSNSPLFRNKSFSRCQDLFSVSSQNLSGECSLLDKELDVISRMDYQSPTSVKQIEESLERILKPSLMKHITADSPGESNDNQNFMGHITADSEVFEDSNFELKTKNKKLKTRKSSSFTENKKVAPLPVETKLFNGAKKSLSKHITADSECTETLDSESLRSNSSRQSKQSEISEHLDPYKNFNPKNFKCGFCTEDIDPYCFICHDSVSRKGSNIRHKCSLYQCSRFYHPECLKLWPQTQWSLIQTTKNRFSHEEIDSFVCPQHVCHTCVSDNPRASIARCSGDKIVKCLCCPTSYHSTNLCVPAGSEIITSTQIVCPRHRNKSKNHTINTTWCLLCNEGGNLICCENCPTSVHPECMTVNLTDDDKFICEDCESGRLPLYDEIVWVKVGQYKWWPGLILFPNEVPLKVLNAKHSPGDFVVKFFGTYDYYWVNRGRSFLFQEGDTIDTGLRAKNKVLAVFKKAVEEAVVAHKMKKQFKSTQTAESASSLKPPPYIKIKVSKPVGNVKLMELDLSNITACECDPSQPNPCGPDSNCLNRILWTECNPEVCPAGTMCNNQSFEKREYPPLVPYKTETRGWGLKALALIKRGQFVIEYVGELIDDEEYQRRIQKMQEQKEDNYYFLTIHTNRMIDAGPKGNVARFMNHCCQPNCETQKWTVNGETRVGLFATEDILAHSELTFNYNLECTGTEKKVCKCGAAMCSGFIGVKVKQEVTESKKPKKSYIKKKVPVKEVVLPPCFICQKKGDVGLCNNKICNKAYHLKCLKLEEWPEGKKFVCRWHYCNLCSKRTIRCCVKCLDSFCPSHSEGNIRYDNLMGFVCKIHEPSTSQTIPIPIKKKRVQVTSEDAIVTSTTDDNEDDNDDVPLEIRKKIKKSKKEKANASPTKELEIGSQNETVSSAMASNELRLKRKRKPKRKMQNKRIKLKVNEVITANINNGSNITK